MKKNLNRPGKLLVAMDFSPQSSLALDRAIALAAQWSARLYVMHAVDGQPQNGGGVDAHMKAAEAEIERRILSNTAGSSIDIDIVATLGSPAERILAECDRLMIDVCVMGSGERNTLARKILGTTVEHVLRHAMQPVLSVRKPVHDRYRKIAIATDFSPASRSALDCALAFFPQSDVALLHAYEVALHGPFEFDRVTGAVAEKHEREMTQHVDSSLQALVEDAQALGIPLHPVSVLGDPHVMVSSYAKQNCIDLVVVGTHGRTGFRRAVLGSVAERIIGSVTCDVLAVRAPE